MLVTQHPPAWAADVPMKGAREGGQGGEGRDLGLDFGADLPQQGSGAALEPPALLSPCNLSVFGDIGSHQATPTPPVREAVNPHTDFPLSWRFYYRNSFLFWPWKTIHHSQAAQTGPLQDCQYIPEPTPHKAPSQI